MSFYVLRGCDPYGEVCIDRYILVESLANRLCSLLQCVFVAWRFRRVVIIGSQLRLQRWFAPGWVGSSVKMESTMLV